MKISGLVCLALVLSGCNLYAFRQILASEPVPIASVSHVQIDCTANGLSIFEGFPQIVRSHPITISSLNSTTGLSSSERNSAKLSSDCLTSLDNAQ